MGTTTVTAVDSDLLAAAAAVNGTDTGTLFAAASTAPAGDSRIEAAAAAVGAQDFVATDTVNPADLK